MPKKVYIVWKLMDEGKKLWQHPFLVKKPVCMTDDPEYKDLILGKLTGGKGFATKII